MYSIQNGCTCPQSQYFGTSFPRYLLGILMNVQLFNEISNIKIWDTCLFNMCISVYASMHDLWRWKVYTTFQILQLCSWDKNGISKDICLNALCLLCSVNVWNNSCECFKMKLMFPCVDKYGSIDFQLTIKHSFYCRINQCSYLFITPWTNLRNTVNFCMCGYQNISIWSRY